MTAPDLRSTLRAAGQLLFTALMLGAGVMAMAWAWVSLGSVSIDQFIGMLLAGVVVVAEGFVAAVLWVVWSRLAWRRRQKRMRSYVLHHVHTSRTGSLGSVPFSAAEGRTSPAVAAGPETTARPDSSIADLDSWRERR